MTERIVRKRNDYLNAGISPLKAEQLARLREIGRFMYGEKNELDTDLAQLEEGVEEGHYDPESMTWKDANGGEHSQRCNARALSERESPKLPDGTEHY